MTDRLMIRGGLGGQDVFTVPDLVVGARLENLVEINSGRTKRFLEALQGPIPTVLDLMKGSTSQSRAYILDRVRSHSDIIYTTLQVSGAKEGNEGEFRDQMILQEAV